MQILHNVMIFFFNTHRCFPHVPAHHRCNIFAHCHGMGGGGGGGGDDGLGSGGGGGGAMSCIIPGIIDD